MKIDPQRLLDAEVYPHPVGKFELLETHISWVVLTGDWAYKLKKPLNLGFLDYSTLQRRHYCCQEELRLNRRLAPDIYVDVVALTQQGDRLRFEGPGEPLEYAVRMRQFPQESLYDRQLMEGRLTRSQMDRLGRFVAGFHAQADRAQAESPFGEPEAIQGPALDNFATLLQLEPWRGHCLLDLQHWTEQAFVKLEASMRERKAGGFVRELHGDLHLGNVAEIHGQPLPFDGIEFNPSLRWTDTMNDLAFLVSDLEHRGRPDFGHLVLDAYLEESGDYSGLALWNYYVMYRWMVRAKVVALRKSQGHPEVDEEIDTYLNQAVNRLRERQPQLVLTHGLSGSGKTVLSQSLLESGTFIRLRSDVARKRLHGMSPWQSSGSGINGGIYTPDQSKRTYQNLAEDTRHLLRAGQCVVVDATFLKRWQRDMFRQLAEQEGAPCRLLHMEVPEALLRRRIIDRQNRGGDASEADLEVLSHQLLNQEPLQEDEAHQCMGESLPPGDELLRTLEIPRQNAKA